ncbi:MAG: EAL domain-containing protein [Sedimenticola sp.]|nr:EAL domain-containing protein [Sedimenticola sp.]
MTLSRQLALLIVVLLLLAFAGTFLITLHNARDYLERQLRTHAEDAATYLGLSISSRAAGTDEATITSMTDALFDRGYYRSIRVESLQGEVLVERARPLQESGVPEWFVARFPIAAPGGEAALMDGWVQQGRVLVRSHPGYAYAQLWATAVATVQWFLLLAVGALLLGSLVLRRLLRPLKQVEAQANAICEREFPVLEPLPSLRDMRRIVEAMNRMSGRVGQMLDDLERLASDLRAQAYQHPVTGLPNRRYFNDMLIDQVDSAEEFSRGALMLVELKGFKQYNAAHGYQAGDALLRELASRLLQLESRWPRSQVAHLSGAGFALLVRECSESRTEVLAEQLVGMLTGLDSDGRFNLPEAGHVGVAYFDGRQSAGDLLSEADTALRMAQAEGTCGWSMRRAADGMEQERPRGATEWRRFIQDALDSGLLQLQFQSVVSVAGRRLLHREVLVRLPQSLDAQSSGVLMTAALFMPQAESLDMSGAIDRAVVSQLLERMKDEARQEVTYAINLSPRSLAEEGFIDWLIQILSQYRSEAGRLIFELPEYGILQDQDLAQELAARVSAFGSRISVDHVGRSFGPLSYLRSLKVHCLKIDGSFMRSLDQNRDNRFFVQALSEIAHGLDIEVIAEAVESEGVWELLAGLRVDGAQGFYVGRPE